MTLYKRYTNYFIKDFIRFMHSYNTKNNLDVKDFTLTEQDIEQIQKDLKNNKELSFIEKTVLPTTVSLSQRIEQNYPILNQHQQLFVQEIYRRLRKKIKNAEQLELLCNIEKNNLQLLKKVNQLAQPTLNNKQKNLGLTFVDFLDLTDKLKKGDEYLIDKIYLTHFKRCMSFLRSDKNATFHEAEDSTSEALEEIRQDLLADKIFYGNLAYYFTNRASRILIKKRKKKKEDNLPENSADKKDDTDIEKEYINTELRNIVSEAINKLCDECSTIIRLYFYEEKKHKEIAIQMDKSHEAIRKQSTKCRNKLRKILGDNFYKRFSNF